MAIIDQATFDAAQKRHAKNRARASRNRKREYLLAGHIQCICNKAMCGRTAIKKGCPTRAYYRCADEVRGRHLRRCREREIRADVADPIVWEWTGAILFNERVKAQRKLRSFYLCISWDITSCL
ncbi:MAG: recombinase zinc beta ribbon domain-containing protein [Chloroflexi bacterium]|nr:recombinase zinc beta ribbon domain-containing protein [Chloroflexota bacterium]